MLAQMLAMEQRVAAVQAEAALSAQAAADVLELQAVEARRALE